MGYKICKNCGISKLDEEYNWKVKYIRRDTRCKECTREYVKDHYSKNRDYYISKVSRIRDGELTDIGKKRKSGKGRIKYVRDYLSSHSCIDCGESRAECLEFDHVRGVKVKDIHTMMHHGYTLDEVIAEIGKCEVRCANCHSIRHRN